MKYSLNLIKHFINIQDTPENISQNLTLKSCEIEHIEKRVIPSDVVIGKVTKVERHPNADKLNVCQVDCGSKGTFQIITGGENVTEDTYVPTAIPGCHLPVINLTIGERQMRGLDSNGMICSKGELGIDEDEDKHWIWTLDEDFSDLKKEDKGTPLAQKYPRLENTILDVDNKTVTHRPDLTGHFGVAVELNAMYQNEGRISFSKLNDYIQEVNESNILEALQNAKNTSKSVNSETDHLRSYLLIEIPNIKVSQSSLLTRNAVRDTDGTPINNWVDFSNLFMNLTGQPVHFFDADKVEGNIVVKQATNGDKFIDLFEVEHELSDQDIVIADDKKIIAVAGVIGGINSGIDENTKNILVEIANFDPISVRKTALRLATRTDASMRFEKNINPAYTMNCVNFFTELLKYFQKDLGKTKIEGISYYIKDQSILRPKTITTSNSKINAVINGETSFQINSQEILEGLGFPVKEKNDSLEIRVPHRRSPSDINIPEDIIEEVARISGYDDIPAMSLTDITKTIKFPVDVEVIRTIEQSLTDKKHYTQVETYPRADEKLMKNLGPHPEKGENWIENLLKLQNALSPETKNLRDSMIYNLFAYSRKNHKFYDDFMIYDIGKTRSETHNENEKVGGVKGSHSHERRSLGGMLYQKKYNNWNDDHIFAAKSHISSILYDLGLKGKLEYLATKSNIYHPKKQATILYNRKLLGTIGQIHPLTLANNKFDQSAQVVYYELNIETLIYWYNQKKNNFAQDFETLQDQIIYRDLCFTIDKECNFGKIIDAVKKVKAISDIRIFDLYQGKNIDPNKKSIAFSITIKGDGNMTTEEINSVMDIAIEKAEQAGGELRK